MIKTAITSILTARHMNHTFIRTIANNFEHNYMHGNSMVSTKALFRKFPKEVMLASKYLSLAGIVTSVVKSKYASMELNLDYFNQGDQYLLSIDRYQTRFQKYLLRNDTTVYATNLVKTPHGVIEEGPHRYGFMASAKNTFSFDTISMAKHRSAIVDEVIKGLKKQHELGKLTDTFFADDSNFGKIAVDLVDYYIDNPKDIYNNEFNVGDMRRRAIFQSMKRVMNPISYKVARSLMIPSSSVTITTEDTKAIRDIYYFIAELTKVNKPTMFATISAAKRNYANKVLPDIDDISERIWCERVYAQLDTLYANGTVEWHVLLEADARASVLQIYAALTGDAKGLTRTSVLGEMKDAWNHPIVPRPAMKQITPRLYGSSESFANLCKHRDIKLSKKQLKALNLEATHGDFAAANQLKVALIKGATINTPSYTAVINGEELVTYVNKFKAAGSKLEATRAWDTVSKKYKIAATHSVIKVPDYARFALYTPTGLVHVCDSQIMDGVADKFSHRWLLTIHDAILGLPGHMLEYREDYTNRLYNIYANRETIVKDYMVSIGAYNRKGMVQFAKIAKLVTPVPTNSVFNSYCMK